MGRLPAVPGVAAIPDDHPLALVWIDSRHAIVARREGDAIKVETLRSDVPAHRRSTGHVRHDPTLRHGGGGSPQTAGEHRRLEHLARFLHEVEQHLPPATALLLLGPGTVHERLAREVRTHDAHHRIERDVRCEVAPRMSQRQLIARLRMAASGQTRRRTVGAYRWTDPTPPGKAGGRVPCHDGISRRAGIPRRVVVKRSRPTIPPQSEGVT